MAAIKQITIGMAQVEEEGILAVDLAIDSVHQVEVAPVSLNPYL